MTPVWAAGQFIRWGCLPAGGSRRGRLPPPLKRQGEEKNKFHKQPKRRERLNGNKSQEKRDEECIWSGVAPEGGGKVGGRNDPVIYQSKNSNTTACGLELNFCIELFQPQKVDSVTNSFKMTADTRCDSLKRSPSQRWCCLRVLWSCSCIKSPWLFYFFSQDFWLFFSQKSCLCHNFQHMKQLDWKIQ